MIEFAKLHVRAALEAASEKATSTRLGFMSWVDKPSILSSYPEELIK